MPRIGDLAAQDAYDVPLDQGTGVGWANRAAEALYARPPYDPTVVATTASPLVNITEGDIGRATEAAMGVSGGGLSTKGIKAYHSSPHDFERFDLSKIGTGEGAQVYGHGLYFAENPAVSGQGGEYWSSFQRRFSGPEYQASERLRGAGFDREKAIENVNDRINRAINSGDTNKQFMDEQIKTLQLLESGKPVGPRTYEVNINADPARMLDWDKGLHRQSPEVQKALARYGIEADPIAMKAHDDALLGALTGGSTKVPNMPWDPFGKDIYHSREIARNPVAASEALREAGIPGIKYLDEGSRYIPGQVKINRDIMNMPVGQQGVTQAMKDQAALDLAQWEGKKPTSNYVVFDPSIINIMKKYGIAGAAPAGMGALAAQTPYREY